MRIDISTVLVCLTTLGIVVDSSMCIAQESSRQSPAAKQAAKARAYADRDNGNGQADDDRASAEHGKAQEGNKVFGVDEATLRNTQKESGDTFKSIEKVFDLMK